MGNDKQKIYRELNHSIGKEELQKLITEGREHNLIFHGITEQVLFSDIRYERLDMSFLSRISSLDYGKKYRVLLLGFTDKNSGEGFLADIEKLFHEKYNIYLTTIWEGLLIGILPENRTGISEIKKLYHEGEKIEKEIKIGCGTIKYALEDSRYGLQEALRTYDMIETVKKYRENLLLYEDLGIYGLLYELKDPAVFERYCTGIFQGIWQYDSKNDSQLFSTLECYFRNECDKLKTAEELFIHENTLRYRLHQIEKILGKSLKNINVITDLVTAFKVRRMMQILDTV